MRHSFLIALVIALCPAASAQTVPYKVVFDLTSKDSLDQKAVIRWVKGITASNPEAELEVVMYGKGLELVVAERSRYTADIVKLMAMPNVSFVVCAVAMKNNNVVASQLIPGVLVLPDGIYEIISKQHEGWGYIKVGH
jgi:intracellular sulfur oxidation DsrE/DsrF family protein